PRPARARPRGGGPPRPRARLRDEVSAAGGRVRQAAGHGGGGPDPQVGARQGGPMKIDVFPHIFPKRFFDRMCEVVSPSHYMQKRTRAIPVLTDLDLRFRIMDRYEGYVQVLTLCSPPLEAFAGPELAADLARLANDGMAEIVERHPDRFPGFVASPPMNHADAAVHEVDRAINDLRATGVQIFSNVNGEPLHAPAYQPV